MDYIEVLEEMIIREIEQTEKKMHSKDLREDSDRFMPKIDTLNWVLDEILSEKEE
jgi:hypothetical protein